MATAVGLHALIVTVFDDETYALQLRLESSMPVALLTASGEA